MLARYLILVAVLAIFIGCWAAGIIPTALMLTVVAVVVILTLYGLLVTPAARR